MKIAPAFILLLVSTVLFAHSGRTDSNGGHRDRKRGGYHYHHGYSAHDHENGVCPYAESTRKPKKNDGDKAAAGEVSQETVQSRKIGSQKHDENPVSNKPRISHQSNKNEANDSITNSKHNPTSSKSEPGQQSTKEETSSSTGWYVLGGTVLAFWGYKQYRRGKGN